MPELQRLPPGETVRPFQMDSDHIGFDEYDVANQGLISHHIELIDGHYQLNSVPFRYVWPAELDLMARLAGMTPARPLERLGPHAVHERQPQARLGLAEVSRCGYAVGHAARRAAGARLRVDDRGAAGHELVAAEKKRRRAGHALRAHAP